MPISTSQTFTNGASQGATLAMPSVTSTTTAQVEARSAPATTSLASTLTLHTTVRVSPQTRHQTVAPQGTRS